MMDTTDNEQKVTVRGAAEATEPQGGFWSRLANLLARVPARVWIRVGIVGSALCLIKCGVLISLRGELFQAHWRVSREMPGWIDYPAFYGLAILMGMNLWVFGQKCAAKDVGSVRASFVMLMLCSSAFVALTFHEGDFGYVTAVVSGSLGWRDLGPYFMMNFCFRPPFLAVWLFLLGAGYYVLWRTGRERFIVLIIAVFAPTYLVLHLRDLIHFQAQLLVLNAVGIACLISGARRERGLPWFVAFSPWLLMASGFLFFGGLEWRIALPTTEFLVMVCCCGLLFVGGAVIARRWRFYDAWSLLVPFASVSFLVLVSDYFPLARNYRDLLLWGLALPRYFMGEIGIAAALALAAWGYCKWRPKGALWWLDLTGLGLIALAFVDLRLVQIMGVRIDWQVITASDIKSPEMIWRMARPYLPMLVLASLVVSAMYVLLYRFAHHILPRQQEGADARSSGWRYTVSVAVLLGIAGLGMIKPDQAEGQVVASLVKPGAWWKQISQPMYSREELLREAHELGLETMLANPRPPSRSARDLNVVLIFQESVYNKHLSLFGGTNETQPLLSQYRDRMELFPNFHSSFGGSIHARFATFTGLYPVLDYADFTRHHVPVKSIFELLDERGYECSMFYSSFYDYTNFRGFLRGRGLALMYDADTMPGANHTDRVTWGVKEHETLAAMQAQIEDYGRNGRRFFMTYVPAAPHYPFDGVPDRFRKFKMDKMGDYTPRYLNELLYTDWVIDEIIGQLKDSGLLDKTLVIITSDHGEMLGDDGGAIGHGWELNPELTNIPLIILDPENRGLKVNPVIGSQVDILPTVLDLLGIHMPDGGIYQGVSLYDEAVDLNRAIYLNSYRKFGVIRGQSSMYFGDRVTDDYSTEGSFVVTNRGSQACFLPVEACGDVPDIARFDRFQGNLLRHYGDYVRTLRSSSSPE